MPAPVAVVVMGVAGSGKSTVGADLARRIGAEFLDADALHSQDARDQMAQGIPLADTDRWPWLERVGERLRTDAGQGVVVACSALKRSYRDALRACCPDVRFMHLHGSAALLQTRMAARSEHFMPTSLLPSQLKILELLASDEDGLVLDIGDKPSEIVDRGVRWLQEAPLGT